MKTERMKERWEPSGVMSSTLFRALRKAANPGGTSFFRYKRHERHVAILTMRSQQCHLTDAKQTMLSKRCQANDAEQTMPNNENATRRRARITSDFGRANVGLRRGVFTDEQFEARISMAAVNVRTTSAETRVLHRCYRG